MPRDTESSHLVVSNDTNASPTSSSLQVPMTFKDIPFPPASGGRIVVLNGFPGTGKLTILKQARTLLPADITCLLDNHLLIDPVVAILPDRSDEHHQLRRMVRAPIFKKLGERAKDGCIILMTACLVEDNERDAAFLKEHLDMVYRTGVPIFWVNAHCDQKVLEQRVQSPGRCQGGKTKLTDVSILQGLLRQHRLIDPSNRADASMKLVLGDLDVSGPLEVSVGRLLGMIGFSEHITSA